MILVEEFIQLNLSQAFKEMFFYVIQLEPFGCGRHLFPQTESLLSKQTKAEKNQTWDIWKKSDHRLHPSWRNRWAFERLGGWKSLNATVEAWHWSSTGSAFIVTKQAQGREPSITDFSQLTYGGRHSRLVCSAPLDHSKSIAPGSSILGSIVLGTLTLHRDRISFFMSIPIMFESVSWRSSNSVCQLYRLEFAVLLSGMLTAFLVSIVAIKFWIGYLKRNDFSAFGWYRIVLGAIVPDLFYVCLKNEFRHPFGIWLFILSSRTFIPLLTIIIICIFVNLLVLLLCVIFCRSNCVWIYGHWEWDSFRFDYNDYMHPILLVLSWRHIGRSVKSWKIYSRIKRWSQPRSVAFSSFFGIVLQWQNFDTAAAIISVLSFNS